MNNSSAIQILEDQIQILQKSYDGLRSQVDSLAEQVERLQQEVIQLESKLENPKYALSESPQPLESSKTIQQGDYILEGKNTPYLKQNDPKRSTGSSEVRNTTYQRKGMEVSNANSLSDAPKIDFKPLSSSQQYNITSNEEKALNEPGGLLRLPNFITLSKISEQEKIEIIQRGFQLQAQETISLKKYYESTDPNSLYQWKGYSIKYESIRRTSLYKSLKE